MDTDPGSPTFDWARIKSLLTPEDLEEMDRLALTGPPLDPDLLATLATLFGPARRPEVERPEAA